MKAYNQTYKAYDFDDILIEPAVFSSIESREDISIKDGDGKLPLFAAPMDTVVCKDNYNIFEKNGIHYIRPRTKECPASNITSNWVAYSLDQFESCFCNEAEVTLHIVHRVLIDVANGHMLKLYNAVKKAKSLHGNNLIIMVGNVATPETAIEYAKIGVDYIRLGIGAGAGCLTTEQTGIGYPMASLINDCRSAIDAAAVSHDFRIKHTKLVADGGFKKYADIIKALALGADFVMLGSMFNKALESAGDTFFANKKYDSWTEPGEQVDQFSTTTALLFQNGQKFYKKFRGMSTKEVQKTLGAEKIKTSEGITKMQPVEYTLAGWVENFNHYLRSAMSYSDAKDLDTFRKKANILHITNNSLNRYTK